GLVEVVQVPGQCVIEHADLLRVGGDFDITVCGGHRAGSRLISGLITSACIQSSSARADEGDGCHHGSGGEQAEWAHEKSLSSQEGRPVAEGGPEVMIALA